MDCVVAGTNDGEKLASSGSLLSVGECAWPGPSSVMDERSE